MAQVLSHKWAPILQQNVAERTEAMQERMHNMPSMLPDSNIIYHEMQSTDVWDREKVTSNQH